jgi:hypothetical protein
MARMRFVLGVILVGAIVFFAGNVTPAHTIRCGDTLGPGGSFQLEQDLDCPPNVTALTIKDGAVLDLNGHIVNCSADFGCITLSGFGAQLLNGAVRGGTHDPILVAGTGGHTLRNITSSKFADGNIIVRSDQNRLINVTATAGFVAALTIGGNNNQLSDSIVQCFSSILDACISVSGDGNRVLDNFVTSLNGSRAGLLISGNNNVVRRNRAINNDLGFSPQLGAGAGIVVTGTGNDLRNNTSLENDPLDVRDTNGDCAHNTWRSNTFQTRDPQCIQ